MRRRLIAASLAAAAACLLAAAAIGARPPAGSAAGVYSAEQAEGGAQLYEQRCASCHGRMLEGTYEIPALTGVFVARWANRPVGDLYDYIGKAMPQFAPGTLSADESAKLVAFLLKANGAPAGAAPLPADLASLHAIRLDPVRAQ